MNRLQEVLLLVLVVLAAILVDRVTWGFLVPAVTAVIAAVPTLLAAVPGWVWWTAFGIAMWWGCPMKAAWPGGCGRRSSRAACTASGSSTSS